MLPFERFIKERMSEKRFIHSVNVAKTARWLAFKYDVDDRKAVIAGILHDITKEWLLNDHLSFLHTYNVGVSSYEYASPKLFHAITASCYAKVILKITDIDILQAIRFHTTGRPGMSPLEKVIFLADGISEERRYSGVNELRYIAEYSLDDAVFKEISGIISDELLKKGRLIHPDTFNAYNEFILLRAKKMKNLYPYIRISDYINLEIVNNRSR